MNKEFKNPQTKYYVEILNKILINKFNGKSHAMIKWVYLGMQKWFRFLNSVNYDMPH